MKRVRQLPLSNPHTSPTLSQHGPRPDTCSHHVHFADYLDVVNTWWGQSLDRSILPTKAINPVCFALIFAWNAQTGRDVCWVKSDSGCHSKHRWRLLSALVALVSVIKRNLWMEADYCWAEGVQRPLGHLSPQPICNHIPMLMRNAWQCSLCSRMQSG